MPDSTPVLQFSLAASSGYGDKKVTTWINCSVFGKRAEVLSPMLAKGDRVGVTGELTNRPWTDKQGNEKYSLELRVSELTLLGTKKDVQPSEDRPERNEKNPTYQPSAPSGNFDDFESDIPF